MLIYLKPDADTLLRSICFAAEVVFPSTHNWCPRVFTHKADSLIWVADRKNSAGPELLHPAQRRAFVTHDTR